MLLSLCTLASALFTNTPSTSNENWPGWRGPGGNGVAEGAPPTEWSEEKNVRWKVALPGKGNSSPIVWGGRVFVTCAVPTGKKPTSEASGAPPRDGFGLPDAGDFQERPQGQDGGRRGGRGRGPGGGPGGPAPVEEQDFVVLAFDRASGKTLWEKKVATAMPHQGTHPDGTYASPTPVTDGEHLIVSFGSYGFFCFTLDGTLVWQKDLGDLDIVNAFGEGSSPVLSGNTLVIAWDNNGDSFVVALDKATGAEKWRRPRPATTNWSTPLVVDVGGKPQVIVGSGRMIAYDLATGEERWSLGDSTDGGVISSPVAHDGVLVASFGRHGSVSAVDLAQAKGKLGEDNGVLWSSGADVPHVSSPLVYDGIVYMLKQNSGLVSALDLATGERLFGPERMSGLSEAYASPVAAAGHIYFAGRDGTFEVVAAGHEFKSLAVNKLEDAFDSSPAVAGNELFLRGSASLYCIAAK